MAAPADQAEIDRLALPAMTGGLPRCRRHRALDRAHDVGRQPQAEQIGLAAAFRLAHRRLAGPGDIAAQQPGLAIVAQAVQQVP